MNKPQNMHYILTEPALRLKSKSRKVFNKITFFIIYYL